MLAVGYVLWTAWTMRYVRSHPVSVRSVRLQPDRDEERLQPDRDEGRLQQDPTVRLKADTTYDWTGRRHVIILAIVLAPMAAYVYGALRVRWGLNELSAAFLIAGLAAGLVGGFGAERTVLVYLECMQSMLPAVLIAAGVPY